MPDTTLETRRMPAPTQAVNTLLVTLGASPAVVPEAFLMPGGDFQAVHVLTSEIVDDSLVRDWFAARAPEVALSICRVRGFRDLRTEDDHFRFEEVLFRWWLSIGAARPHVCLSGGFKTMSTAIERASEVFGAAEVFHVLAELPPRPGETRPRQPATIDQIDEARTAQSIRWIRLGGRPGWPGARGWKASDYPLHAETSPESTARVSSPDSRLREEVLALAERSRRISEHWDSLAGLPFNELATWSPQNLAWLDGPLDPESDLAWIEALPKVELHCHLGGFATSGMELEAVRAAAENPSTLPPVRNLAEPNGWPFPTSPIGLEPYRHLGDNNGSALLRDRGCLREQCRRLYKHLCGQNILYAEIRCSPANYSSLGRSPWTVLRDIKSCFDECMNAAVKACMPHAPTASHCRVNLLLIGTRQPGGDFRAGISRHLALAVTAADHWRQDPGCQVVGVDLAGFEDASTRAHYFREEFTAIHRCGLALTVHAGENDDAEGIWSAVFDLNARRLGHALHLADCPELLRSVAERGIAVEMCPYANFQIKGFAPMPGRPAYPLLDYLKQGVRVTVNTDNIGISAGSLGDNLLQLSQLCPGITRMQILQLLRNAIDSAFLSTMEKSRLLRAVSSRIPLP